MQLLKTIQRIMSCLIRSHRILSASLSAGKKQILFRAIMSFAHCRWRRLASLYIAADGASRSQSHKGWMDHHGWVKEGRKEKDLSQREKEDPPSRPGLAATESTWRKDSSNQTKIGDGEIAAAIGPELG